MKESYILWSRIFKRKRTLRMLNEIKESGSVCALDLLAYPWISFRSAPKSDPR